MLLNIMEGNLFLTISHILCLRKKEDFVKPFFFSLFLFISKGFIVFQHLPECRF